MTQRKSILHRATHGTQLRTEPIIKRPIIEVVGTGRVLIENHCGITQYGTERIMIKTRFGHIYIAGTELSLAMMSKERLIITGCISQIHLLKGGAQWDDSGI